MHGELFMREEQAHRMAEMISNLAESFPYFEYEVSSPFSKPLLSNILRAPIHI
jgi:hypothetical protein